MLQLILTLLMILTLNSCASDAIISKTDNIFSARQMGQSMALCFSENFVINCLENKIFEAMDKAIANNETWQLTDYLIIEKNSHSNNESVQNPAQNQKQAQERSLSDTLALKMLKLAQTRSIKLQLSPTFSRTFEKRGLSSALDDFDGGANAVDNGLDDSREQMEQEEGRKKKDKDKNMAMIGGMAMMAMVAQMFLGKVILIAGAAFIMAKVALLISVLGSLKKGPIGSGGGTDHVIVTGGGGGGGSSGGHSHEYSSGWHRSMPYDYNKWETTADDENKHSQPVTYEISHNDDFQKQQQQQQQNIKVNNVHY